MAETPSESRQGWEQLLLRCRIDVEALRPDLLEGLLGAAVLLAREDGTFTADASGENAHTACEIETLACLGPGTTAIETGELVHVEDVALDTRWRLWRRAVKGLWRSALALPVTLDGTPGAVVLYAAAPDRLQELRSAVADVIGRVIDVGTLDDIGTVDPADDACQGV